MRARGRTGRALREHLRSHVATYWWRVEPSDAEQRWSLRTKDSIYSALNPSDGNSKALIQVRGGKKGG